MERLVDTKFYEFRQNNSGGHLDIDDNVGETVIIEALDFNQARAKMEDFTEDQSYSCPCCGERWSLDFEEEIELPIIMKSWRQGSVEQVLNTIEKYCKYRADEATFSGKESTVVLHYIDGTKVKFLKQ